MVQQHYAIMATNTISFTEYTHRLLEICIIRRTADRVVDTFRSLLNPRCILPEDLSEVNGINQDAVRFEPVFCEVAEEILDILDGAILVSHNANFNYRVLRDEFKTIGYKFTSPVICTSKLAERAFPSLNMLRLGNVCDYLAIPYKHLNRAEGKAQAIQQLFGKLISQKYTFPEAANQFLPDNAVQYKVDLLNLNSLERKPGVYYFKDSQDNIIYIGKAVRLRDRVRSHFNNKSEREQKLCSATSKVDFVYTGSNLIAELLESDEIKEHLPPFNIAQKNKTTPYIIVSTENKNGYLQLSIIRKDYSDSVNEVFYNRSSVAKKLREICGLFTLCPKFCGFHRIRGKCNHSTLINCPGACVGEETVDTYNLRVRAALNFLEDDFENFAIKVQGRKNGEMGFVLVRNGVYLGYGFVGMNEQIASFDDFENYLAPKTHSYHTTRIIDSYIRKPRNKSNILLLN